MNGLGLYMKAFLDRHIHLVPIIMLFATLFSNYVDYIGCTYNYVVLGNAIGYSIASNIIVFYFFNFKVNYCWFTRNAPIGLFIVNIVDILGSYIPYSIYSKLFNIAICTIICTLALIFYIKKRLA
jgi:hypothetical protein